MMLKNSLPPPGYAPDTLQEVNSKYTDMTARGLAGWPASSFNI